MPTRVRGFLAITAAVSSLLAFAGPSYANLCGVYPKMCAECRARCYNEWIDNKNLNPFQHARAKKHYRQCAKECGVAKPSPLPPPHL
jgi:hypothetical protein